MHLSRLSVLFVLSAAVTWGTTASASDILPKGLTGRCVPLVGAALNRWGSKGDWQRELSNPGVLSTHRSPSNETGVWIALSKTPTGTIRAVRESLSLRTTIEWTESDCVPRMAAQPIRYRVPASELKKTFTDERLKALLKRSKDGLIYSWSPQMPLSAGSLAEVRKTASTLHLPLTLVLDPSADRRLAESFARANRFPAESTLPMQSLELLHRGMGEHYPSLIVYRKGEVVGRAFPGYKSSERYMAFVNSRLSQTSKEGVK